MTNAVLVCDFDTRVMRIPVYDAVGQTVPFNRKNLLGWRDIRLPHNARSDHRYVAVIVRDDELRGAAIVPDDYAVLLLGASLRGRRELAAVVTPHGLTIKYVYESQRDVRLVGDGLNYQPQHFTREQISVHGVVVRIERDYL